MMKGRKKENIEGSYDHLLPMSSNDSTKSPYTATASSVPQLVKQSEAEPLIIRTRKYPEHHVHVDAPTASSHSHEDGGITEPQSDRSSQSHVGLASLQQSLDQQLRDLTTIAEESTGLRTGRWTSQCILWLCCLLGSLGWFMALVAICDLQAQLDSQSVAGNSFAYGGLWWALWYNFFVVFGTIYSWRTRCLQRFQLVILVHLCMSTIFVMNAASVTMHGAMGWGKRGEHSSRAAGGGFIMISMSNWALILIIGAIPRHELSASI